LPPFITHPPRGWWHLSDILGDPINGDDLKQSPIDDWDRDNLRWVDTRYAIREEKADFVAGFTEDHLRYVARLSDDKVEKVVCEFSEGPPKATVVKSVDPTLCAAVQGGKLQYPDYSELVTLDNETETSSFTSVGSGAAELDLENDGQKRWIVQMQFSSSHGSGCDETYPGVLRADKKAIDSGRTESLSQLVPSCGSSVRPFVYKDATYLEVSPPVAAHPTERKILRRVGGQSKEMCTISTHSTYTVVGR
jgi:hypothetical protein